MRHLDLLRTVLLLGLAALVGACGGKQRTYLPELPEIDATAGADVPSISDELDAILDSEPTNATEALIRSWVADAAAMPDESVAALLTDVDWSDDWLSAIRALRLLHMRDRLSGKATPDASLFHGIIGAWLEHDPGPIHPVEAVVRAELGLTAAAREHNFGMNEGIVDRAAWGAPTRWRMVGPFSEMDVLDFDREFRPDTDAALRDVYEFEGGSLDSRFVVPQIHGSSVPIVGSGIYYAEAFFTAPQETEAVLAVSSSARWTVFIDGVDVATRGLDDVWESSLRFVRVRVPAGDHRVLVRYATKQRGCR